MRARRLHRMNAPNRLLLIMLGPFPYRSRLTDRQHLLQTGRVVDLGERTVSGDKPGNERGYATKDGKRRYVAEYKSRASMKYEDHAAVG